MISGVVALYLLGGVGWRSWQLLMGPVSTEKANAYINAQKCSTLPTLQGSYCKARRPETCQAASILNSGFGACAELALSTTGLVLVCLRDEQIPEWVPIRLSCRDIVLVPLNSCLLL